MNQTGGCLVERSLEISFRSPNGDFKYSRTFPRRTPIDNSSIRTQGAILDKHSFIHTHIHLYILANTLVPYSFFLALLSFKCLFPISAPFYQKSFYKRSEATRARRTFGLTISARVILRKNIKISNETPKL